jgi:hypothetical protein
MLFTFTGSQPFIIGRVVTDVVMTWGSCHEENNEVIGVLEAYDDASLASLSLDKYRYLTSSIHICTEHVLLGLKKFELFTPVLKVRQTEVSPDQCSLAHGPTARLSDRSSGRER